MYRKFRLTLLAMLYEFPPTKAWAYKRLPRHRSGYQKHWVGEEGKKQRETLEERQSASLQRFYPTPEKLRQEIAVYNPQKVLDIGCGYGRFMEEMVNYFDVEGCDVAQDLLDRVPENLKNKVFQLDLVHPPAGWVEHYRNNWGVSYAWAVFMYFIDDPISMKSAMENAEAITAKKIIVWDWKHVCDYMQKTHPSDKFEYHHIPLIAG